MKFKLFISGLLSFLLYADAGAVTISGATSSVSPPLGNVDLQSYDKTGYNNLGAVGAVTPLNFLQFSSFEGASGGTDYEMYFLSSVAGYKLQDEFGLLNDKGDFVASINGSQDLGTKATYSQAAGEKLKFGFKSPESLFSSDPNENADGLYHMLAVQSSVNALLTIPQADLQGHSMVFNLLAGDYIFFLEDMLLKSNYNGNNGSDFDYNDFLVVVRAKENITQAPEPATLFLLGGGAIVALRRSRRAKSVV